MLWVLIRSASMRFSWRNKKNINTFWRKMGSYLELWNILFKILGHSMKLCLFVCVEVLRPSQPNGVMSSTVNLPNHTFTGQA